MSVRVRPTTHTIICDVDGVLCDFITRFIEAGHDHGVDLRVPTVAEPDIRTQCEAHGKDLFHELIERVISMPHPAPYSHTRDMVSALQAHGDYLVATAPVPTKSHQGDWYNKRVHWLESLGIPEERIVYVHPVAKAKLEGCMLIEDHEGTVKAWNHNQGRPSGMLIARPWNTGTLTLESAARAVRTYGTLMSAWKEAG